MYLSELGGIVCTVAVSLFLSTGVPAQVSAQASEITKESDARNRMNFAGRQRMLTQQITRNACFVMADADPVRYVAKTEDNARQFNAVLTGLREGDADLGILAESNPEVLAALAQVEDLWATLGPAARQIAAGDYHSIPMEQMINLNMTTLSVMQSAVETMAQRYQNGDVSAEMVATVALAGRQRMLTQKVSKEVCFRTIGLETAGANELVQKTITDFDAAMVKLQEGAPADLILAPPNEQVRQQLQVTNAAWLELKTLIREIKQQPEPDREKLVTLANMSDHVLKEMNKAVQLYIQ